MKSHTRLAGLAVLAALAAAPRLAAAQSATSNGTESVYDVLKNDHRKVQDLFRQVLRANHRADDAFAQIQHALDAHIAAEEKYLYPILERDTRARQDVFVAYEQHSAARDMLDKVDQANDDELWLARLKVLSDQVNAHIDFEESTIFNDAKKALTKQQALDIGRDIQDQLNQAQR